MNNPVIPDAAEATHAVVPIWSVLYDTHKCKTCGKWSYRTSAGEWKHGGTK